MLKKIFKSEFNKNVFQLLTGSTIAQLITLAIIPILTRIFTKEDFGVLQLYLSTITTISVIGSLRLEMAIVLPKDEKESRLLISVSFIMLIIFSILITVILLFSHEYFLGLFDAGILRKYLLFLSVGIFLMGFLQILQQVSIKNRLYTLLARNRIIQVLIVQISALIIGYFNPAVEILLLSQIFGLVIACFILFTKGTSNDISIITYQEMFAVFKEYKKFPLINTPMVFLNTLSVQLPVFMLSKFFSSDVIGLYMIANRFVVAPFQLMLKSVSQVFYQRAASDYQKGVSYLKNIYQRTVKKLSLIGLIPLILLLFFVDIVIDLILEKEWHDSAVFIKILAFWIYFKFIISPVSTVFNILDKQEWALILTLISLLLRFFLMTVFNQTPNTMLIAFTVAASLYYISYHISSVYLIKRKLK